MARNLLLEGDIFGYNPTPIKKTKTPIDRVADYCHEHGISYGEYQRLEFFGKLTGNLSDHLPVSNIYIMKKKGIDHGVELKRGKRNKKSSES